MPENSPEGKKTLWEKEREIAHKRQFAFLYARNIML